MGFFESVNIAFAQSCKQVDDKRIGIILKNSAEQVNKHCPIHIDNSTLLDSITVKSNRTMVYNYTVVNHSKSDMDTNADKKRIKGLTLKNNVCCLR